MGENASGGLGRHLRKKLLTGLVVLLPLFITLWIFGALFRLVDQSITPWVERGLSLLGVGAFGHPSFLATLVPVLGVLITAGIIYLAGVLGTNVFGVRILKAFDRLVLRIPLVRAVYGSSRQLMESLSPGGRRSFSEVVLVEYPRKGCYMLGFVTREAPASLVPGRSETMAAVFLPTAPNPTSGWILLIPRAELVRLSLTVEEGLKWVVSGGVVMPESWDAKGLPPLAEPAMR